VTVQHGSAPAVTVTSTAVVSDPQITVIASPAFTAVEGTPSAAQADVFKFTASISGTVSLAQNGGSQPANASRPQGVAGITVQLQDTSGDVLATTVTDQNGHYFFTQQSGTSPNPEIASGVSATGDYNIVLVLPQNLQQVSPNQVTIHISRGGLHINDVDFTVAFNDSASSAGGSRFPASHRLLSQKPPAEASPTRCDANLAKTCPVSPGKLIILSEGREPAPAKRTGA
jgi:hypothetical protein